MEKKCECCQKQFKTYKTKQIYCSKSCGQCNKRKDKIIKECLFSGCVNTFEVLQNAKQKFCSKSCQCLWQKTYQLGENNGNYGKKNKWGKHDYKTKKLISEKITESWKEESRLNKHNKARENYKSINGYLPTNSPSAREKRSEKNVIRCSETGHLTTYKNCKRGYYKNKKNNVEEYFHSSWEEILMIQLDEDPTVKNWTKKHNLVVKYKHNGILKSYLPDFYIEYIDGTIIIEEVKGYIEDIEIFKLKKKACEKFCSENKFKYKINFMKNYEKYKHLL
jgi:hypothetical protein